MTTPTPSTPGGSTMERWTADKPFLYFKPSTFRVDIRDQDHNIVALATGNSAEIASARAALIVASVNSHSTMFGGVARHRDLVRTL